MPGPNWYFGNPAQQPASGSGQLPGFPAMANQQPSSFPAMQNPNTANMFQQRGLTSQGPSTMPGRIVASEQEILPNEIPMDGSIALFLQSDLQCIYAKAWNNRGTIDNVRYILERPAEPQQDLSAQANDQFQQDLMARLAKIEEMLQGLQTRNNGKQASKPPAQTPVKEGEGK